MAKCECDAPGQCNRHGVYKSRLLFDQCKTVAGFRQFEMMFSQQLQEVAVTPDPAAVDLVVARMNDPCIHRSDNPTEQGECGSCPRGWKYECSSPKRGGLVTIDDCGECDVYE